MSIVKTEHKVYQSLNRRHVIKSYLRDHGSQSLQEMKDGFLCENKIMPFIESRDEEIHEWLNTIEGIIRTNVNGVVKYSIVGHDPSVSCKRKCVSPLAATACQTSKRQMTDRYHEIKVAARFEDAQKWQNRFVNDRQNENRDLNNNENKESPMKHEAPHLFNMPLISDDQILNIALFDLDFDRKPNDRRRQSGGCVSGLRIKEATRRLDNLGENVDRIIVNVGSVDIVEGRQLIHMIRDLLTFIDTCDALGITPIFTTLAPLANIRNDHQKAVLKSFNDFIVTTLGKQYSVIDLYNCMLTPDGNINLNFYQINSRHISGSKKRFVMWNKAGRQRVYNMLLRHLGQAILYDNYVSTNY